MANDWLTQWQWPDDLRAQRWLMLGADLHELGAAATRRGATVKTLPRDDETPLPLADVIVSQELFLRIRHPLWWLEKVCAMTLTEAILHFCPMRMAVEHAMLTFDETQGWQGNRTALARLVRTAGFAHVSILSESSEQLWLRAARQWQDFPAQAAPVMQIYQAVNPVTGQKIFPRSGRHAFAAFFVAGLPADARRWEVRVSIGSFGVQPLRVAPAPDDNLMQVNVALPPGLPLGKATVQLWHREKLAESCEIEVVEGTQW